MNEQTVSPGSVGVRYGIITGFVSIIYSLVLYMTGLHLNKGLSYLGTIIPIVGIVMAYLYYKRENGGFMSYGQGLGTGTILATVSGVLSGTFTYIYMKFIDGNILEQIRNASIEEMENKGMSEEQIEQAATFGLVHKPPSGGGSSRRALSLSSRSGLRTEGLVPFRRRRSPRACGPWAL